MTGEGDETDRGEDELGGGLGDEDGVEGAHGAHGSPDGFGRVGFGFVDEVEEVDGDEAAEHREGEQDVVIADFLAEERAELVGQEAEESAAEDGADGGERAGEGEEYGDVGSAVGGGELEHQVELAELESGGGSADEEVGADEVPPPTIAGSGPGQEPDDRPGERADVEDGFDPEAVAELAPAGQGQQPANAGEGGEPSDVADGSLDDLEQEHRVERLSEVEEQAPETDEGGELEVVSVAEGDPEFGPGGRFDARLHDGVRELHAPKEDETGESGEAGGGEDPSVDDQGIAAVFGDLAGDADGEERPESEGQIASAEETGADPWWDEFADGGGPGDAAEAVGKGGDAEDEGEGEVVGGRRKERQGRDQSPGKRREDERQHHDRVQGHALTQPSGEDGLDEVAEVGQGGHEANGGAAPTEGGDGEGDDERVARDRQVQHGHAEAGLDGGGLEREEEFAVAESGHEVAGGTYWRTSRATISPGSHSATTSKGRQQTSQSVVKRWVGTLVSMTSSKAWPQKGHWTDSDSCMPERFAEGGEGCNGREESARARGGTHPRGRHFRASPGLPGSSPVCRLRAPTRRFMVHAG